MATFICLHGAGGWGADWDLVAAELRPLGHEVVAPDLPSDDETRRPGRSRRRRGGRHRRPKRATSCWWPSRCLASWRRSCARRCRSTSWCWSRPWSRSPVRRPPSGGRPPARARPRRRSGCRTTRPTPSSSTTCPPRCSPSQPLPRPRPLRFFDEPWPLSAWPDVPTRFLACRDDRLFPEPWLRGVVRDRLGIEVDEVPGGHCAYLSHPAPLPPPSLPAGTSRRRGPHGCVIDVHRATEAHADGCVAVLAALPDHFTPDTHDQVRADLAAAPGGWSSRRGRWWASSWPSAASPPPQS